MNRGIVVFALSALVAVPWFAPTRAASLPDMPVGAETTFVKSVQADLMKRFPTAAAAEKAGFFRYTNEDNTGAISYTNGQWQSTDKRKPTQLWYDVDLHTKRGGNGRLHRQRRSELVLRRKRCGRL